MKKKLENDLTPLSSKAVSDEEYNEVMKITNNDTFIDNIDLKCSNISEDFFDDTLKLFEECE